MPTADKRLYCTALREDFNSFALKCFRSIWHWLVWPTVDKSVKPFDFITRLHVSTHFWFLYPSLLLCLPHSISSPLSTPNPTVKWVSIWWDVNSSSCDCSPSSSERTFSVTSPRDNTWATSMCILHRFCTFHAGMWAQFCDFMITFPVSLFPCCLSFLAAGQKWAGREEGMAQKLLSSPSPCSSGVARWYTAQPFPRLAGETEGCGKAFLSPF